MRILHRETVEPVRITRIARIVFLAFAAASVSALIAGFTAAGIVFCLMTLITGWAEAQIPLVLPPQTFYYAVFDSEESLRAAKADYEIIDTMSDIYILMRKSEGGMSGGASV